MGLRSWIAWLHSWRSGSRNHGTTQTLIWGQPNIEKEDSGCSYQLDKYQGKGSWHNLGCWAVGQGHQQCHMWSSGGQATQFPDVAQNHVTIRSSYLILMTFILVSCLSPTTQLSELTHCCPNFLDKWCACSIAYLDHATLLLLKVPGRQDSYDQDNKGTFWSR